MDTIPNVLIVDDIDDNLALLETILKPLGVNLIPAKSGKEALEKIRDQVLALALIDILMPGMSGIELAGFIQKQTYGNLIPIIFITSHVRDKLEIEECYKAGAVDFLLKPINYRILLNKVKIFLELYRQKQQILENHIKLEMSARVLVKINERLIESNEFNVSLLRTIPFGMAIVDEDRNIIFLNDNLIKHFGPNAIGKKCWELFRDDKLQCTDCPLISGLNMEETAIHESKGMIGGKIMQISYTNMMYKGKKAMLEIFQDITEQKHANEILKKNENLLNNIIENLPLMLVIKDAKDLRFVRLNKPLWIKNP